MIESISQISPLVSPDASANRVGIAGSGGADFLSLIGRGVAQVDASLGQATAVVNALASGKDIAIHDVMIAMERARIDLTLMSEVRNRLIEGYQELTRMQL